MCQNVNTNEASRLIRHLRLAGRVIYAQFQNFFLVSGENSIYAQPYNYMPSQFFFAFGEKALSIMESLYLSRPKMGKQYICPTVNKEGGYCKKRLRGEAGYRPSSISYETSPGHSDHPNSEE